MLCWISWLPSNHLPSRGRHGQQSHLQIFWFDTLDDPQHPGDSPGSCIGSVRHSFDIFNKETRRLVFGKNSTPGTP
jgi:hypothetical protein